MLFGWAIYFINIAATGALVAGAFAPWLAYGKDPLFAYVAGYGAVGKGSLAGVSVPSAPVTIADISAVLDCAVKVDTSKSIKWESNSVSVFYLGVVALMIAAGILAFFLLFSTFTCLCTCLSPCCKSSKFNFLLALIKLAVALIGCIALGSQMSTFEAAIKSIAALPPSAIALIAACGIKAEAATLLGIMVANPTPISSSIEGKAFASLGVALLGVSAVLHLLMLIKCGGAKHHPEKNQKSITAGPAGAV